MPDSLIEEGPGSVENHCNLGEVAASTCGIDEFNPTGTAMKTPVNAGVFCFGARCLSVPDNNPTELVVIVGVTR
jgi:hypothetical protein